MENAFKLILILNTLNSIIPIKYIQNSLKNLIL